MNFATLISVEELAVRLGSPDLLVVDCRFDLADTSRGEREYRQAHVPGAVYADLGRDLSDLSKVGLGRHPLPDAAAFALTLGRWGWTAQRQVVCYDDAGGANAAARLWWMLRLIGAGRVAVLDGGWRAWKTSGLALETNTPPPVATTVAANFAADQIVYIDALRAVQRDPEATVLDARAAPRFRGEVEPIDPVAGRIPGAVNRPTTDNLRADGRFKPAAELRAELEALLGTHPPHKVVHSCGSGVSACQNLLAFEHAGLAGSRIFAPSWSGWISDPQNPVERG